SATLANIHANRQRETEDFLRSSFGLCPVWKPLCAPAAAPVWLADRRRWRLFFYKGIFQGIRLLRLKRCGACSAAELLDGIQENADVVRSRFFGDLLSEIRFRDSARTGKFSVEGAEDRRLREIILKTLIRDKDASAEPPWEYRGFHLLRLGRRHYAV